MKTKNLPLAIVLTVAITTTFVVNAAHAQSYRVSYDHYVYATGSADPPIMDDGQLNGQATLYHEFTHSGDPSAPNYGHVRYFANLHTGSLGAYAYATGGVTGNWPYGFTATGRVEKIGFDVTLSFEVPPGTYPGGVTVGMNGCVSGAISATSDAGAKARYSLNWGGDSFLSPPKVISVEDDQSIYFTEPVSLTHLIVGAGTVLADTQSYNVNLSVGLFDLETWAVLGGTSPNYTTGSSLIDMYTGLQITSITCPDAVSWTTEDDVFMSEMTGAESRSIPATAILEQNYPNPFNPSTTIAYELPGPSNVSLRVYDVSGRLVRTLQDGVVGEGRKELTWDGRDDSGRAVPSGVYFCRLVSDSHRETRKMLLLK